MVLGVLGVLGFLVACKPIQQDGIYVKIMLRHPRKGKINSKIGLGRLEVNLNMMLRYCDKEMGKNMSKT